MPHQQRHSPGDVLRDKILHIHLFDLVRSVRVDPRRHAARGECHFPDRLTADCRQPTSDMERAHRLQRDRSLVFFRNDVIGSQKRRHR